MGQRSLNLMFIVSFFIIFNKGIAQDSSELRCYDCDPKNQPDRCGSVEQNGVTEVSCNQKSGVTENSTLLCMSAYVRFDDDINNKVTDELQALKSAKALNDWRSKVLGGGRIKHDPEGKLLNVYGYSQGYGKADHQVAVDILKTHYPDYNITWSDEGY